MIEERKRLKGNLLDAGSPRLKERAATVQRERKRRSQLKDIQNNKWQKTPGEDGECPEMLKAEGKETPHILQRIRT